MRLPSTRVVVVAATAAAAAAALLLWQPWQGSGRRQWTTAPALPVDVTVRERSWLTRLGAWVGYVHDASEDPTSLTVLDCRTRLERLDPAPHRLGDIRSLAADTCAAVTAQARDRRGSQISWDPERAGRANDEEREANRDLRLLLTALKLKDVPGGRVVPRYSRIVSTISGREATARCWSSEANWRAVGRSLARTEPGLTNLLGFAVAAQSRVELSPEVCRQLARPRPSLVAVEVLTHESEHLVGPDGISDEAATDCYAAQRMWRVAGLLGIRRWDRHRLALLYLRVFQPGLPPQYRSAACRSGGRLDLTPRDRRWP